MSTPLVATSRLKWQYTQAGLLHTIHAYVRNATLVGGVYKINSRATDANDTLFSDAADAFIEAYTWVLAADCSIGDATLEQLVSGSWITRETRVFGGTSHLNGSYTKAMQETIVARDINFKKVKFVALESTNGSLYHFPSYTALGAGNTKNWVKEFTSNFTLTNAPYNWVVGRGNQYLNVATIAGLTASFNKKVRRARGLT